MESCGFSSTDADLRRRLRVAGGAVGPALYLCARALAASARQGRRVGGGRPAQPLRQRGDVHAQDVCIWCPTGVRSRDLHDDAAVSARLRSCLGDTREGSPSRVSRCSWCRDAGALGGFLRVRYACGRPGSPRWLPACRSSRRQRWCGRSVRRPQAVSAFMMNHLVLVWNASGHTYAYGFHVVDTLAQARALDLALVRRLTMVLPPDG
jgi:hypothetical protein